MYEEELYAQTLSKLTQQKRSISKQMRQLIGILKIKGVGMHGPLTHLKGYPRNIDISDIYFVLNTRERVRCLKDDHIIIMKQIESGFRALYSYRSGNKSNNRVNAGGAPIKVPFAKVTTIAGGSPAACAGLEVNDLILELGTLNGTNFTSMFNISNVIRQSEGHQLDVKVKRDTGCTVIQLSPKKWSGQGLLGCNIMPL